MTPPDQPRTVVGAVVVRGDRVLAARRRRPAALAGGWEFPGGKVEPGETVVAAVQREVLEELDLAVSVGVELRGPRGAWPISPTYELRLFLATITGVAEPTPGADHDEVRWLAADDLDSVVWLEADRQALLAVRAQLTPSGHRSP